MISVAILLLKTTALLFFTGLGLSILLIPEKLYKYFLWFCPWFGVLLITLLSVAISLARIPMTSGKYIIIIAAIILLFFSLIFKKKIIIFSKENFILGLLTGLIILINIFPLLYKVRFPTSISFGNLDIITYSNVSDFLINHSIVEAKEIIYFKPAMWSVTDFILFSYRWGSPLLLSFFSSFFNVRTYQVFYILLILFFGLSFPLVYILTQILYQSKKYLLMTLTFITYGLNVTILYMLYHVFFGQFIFLGLYVLITVFFYSYISEKKTNSIIPNLYEISMALIIAAVSTIYPEGFLFILAPLSTFVFFNMFFNKKRFYYLLSLLKSLIVACIISPITIGTCIRENIRMFFSTIGVTSIGWENIRNASPIEIIGLYNLNYSRILPLILLIISGLFVSLVWIIGLIKIKNRLLIIINLLMATSFFIMYRYISPNFFTYHRAVTYTIFFFTILFSVGIATIFSLFKNKFIKLIIICIFLALVIRSTYRTLNLFYIHCQIIDRPLASLEELNSNKQIKEPFFTADVYLGEYNMWRRLWQEYFLKDKSIVSLQNYNSIEINKLKKVNLVLAEKSFMEREGKKIEFSKIAWENPYYILGEVKPISVTHGLLGL